MTYLLCFSLLYYLLNDLLKTKVHIHVYAYTLTFVFSDFSVYAQKN